MGSTPLIYVVFILNIILVQYTMGFIGLIIGIILAGGLYGYFNSRVGTRKYAMQAAIGSVFLLGTIGVQVQFHNPMYTLIAGIMEVSAFLIFNYMSS